MRAVDYLVKVLIKYGVTDVFGIPGGVVLDFLYAVNQEKDRICPHLNFHEQAAGFSAVGYAQVHGTLGVAYATRGPGFTNLITAIADAYQESVPVLFITAHAQKEKFAGRMGMDQELDAAEIAAKITKCAIRIDKIGDFIPSVEKACRYAVTARQGPVLLDVHNSIWTQDINSYIGAINPDSPATVRMTSIPDVLYQWINSSKRPVILVGNGVQQSHTKKRVQNFAEKYHIPILSSRGSQDLLAESRAYYGYIGSHGLRHSNFILSKADLIISLGNRLSFPLQSESFAPIFKSARLIRIEVDGHELQRKIPNSINIECDLKEFWNCIKEEQIDSNFEEWLLICEKIRVALDAYDIEGPVDLIREIFESIPKDCTFVSDVGNHEFWVSMAYAYAKCKQRILYSRSFGTLGCALPKSIGVYYKTKKAVICVTGDQGIQFNLQELHFISINRIPIVILLVNNHSSGMIRSHQKKCFYDYFLHVSSENGYPIPDFKKISEAFNILYEKIDLKNTDITSYIESAPFLLETDISIEADLNVYLPKGFPIQMLHPPLDEKIYKKIDPL